MELEVLIDNCQHPFHGRRTDKQISKFLESFDGAYYNRAMRLLNILLNASRWLILRVLTHGQPRLR